MEKILLSVLSAILGFTLSQTFNFVDFLRRPRFKVKHQNDGVLSSYSGDPPETPWEIELGFHLTNSGRNPAKNTRIFVSNIMGSNTGKNELESTSIDFFELKRPIDLIPAGEGVPVKLGTISSATGSLKLNFQSIPEDDQSGLIDADTRGKVRFSAKFFVTCDNKNSFHSFIFDFRPDHNDFASVLLDDYNEEYLDGLTRPKHWNY